MARGLVTEAARALGWLALGKGVSKLPSVSKSNRDGDVNRKERSAGLQERQERQERVKWKADKATEAIVELPIVMHAAATLVGVVLALFPRERRPA